MDIDIDFSLYNIDISEVKKIEDSLPAGYEISDERDRGYGFNITAFERKQRDVKKLDEALINFLEPLKLAFLKKDKNQICSIRIAIYASSFVTTLGISKDSLKVLNDFHGDVEISIYPTTE